MTLTAHVKNGMIVLDEPVALPEGATVQVELVAPTESEQGTTPTLLERLRPFVGMIEDLPSDASVNLDHYLYGTPKRQ